MKLKLSFLGAVIFLTMGSAATLYAAPQQTTKKHQPSVELYLAKVTGILPGAADQKNDPLLKSQYKLTGQSTVKIKKVTFNTADEDGSRYEIFLSTDDFTGNIDLASEESSIVVKVNDTVFIPYSYGGEVPDIFCSIGLGSIDRATAEVINGGPLPMAPKDSLRVEYLPSKSYPLHGPVSVPLNITNIGDSPLTFYWGTTGGQNYPCRDTQQSFTATLDGVPVMANPKPLPDGFISSPYKSTPKSTLHYNADLSQWLQFDKPGKYLIDAIHTITIRNPKEGATPVQWKVNYHNQFSIQIGK